MPYRLLTAIAVLVLLAPATAAQEMPSDAYLDAAARDMVAGARAQDESMTERIRAYEVTSRERISVGLQASQRDRLLFRRETAARVGWERDVGWRMEMLGAREVVPIAAREVRPVRDRALRSIAGGRSFDPANRGFLRVLPEDEEAEDGDEQDIIHPLGPGAESSYRYRSGESTQIRLPDGRLVRLVELQVIPRRAEPNLLSGSFWLDADTNSPVRAVFSLAAPLHIRPSAGFIPLPLPSASFTIRYLTLEYGLWEGRWWMQRLMSFEGSVAVGGASVPLTIEQLFEDYRIYTDETPWAGFEPVDTTDFRIVERRCREDAEECPRNTIVVPRDTDQLLTSPELPRSIYSRTGRLLSERELEELTAFVDAARWRGFVDRIPTFEWRPIDGSLSRYNRVEGLTVGTSAEVGLAPLSAGAALWIGTADRTPSFEVGLGRARLHGEERLSGYRRMEAFSPRDRPFSLAGSISAFAFGRDEGDYYRTLGARLSSEQSVGMGSSLRVAAYAERHTPVEKRTDTSIPNWRDDRLFRPNPAADEAEQVGIEARALVSRGLDPARVRGGVELRGQVETGTYPNARSSVTGFSTFPLPGRLLGAVELSGGTSLGTLPLQREWWVGGRGSVRGIAVEERVSGPMFWSGRAELATERPAARLAVFADAGWAGRRTDLTLDPTLVSAGAGLSFLDGLFRVDLARALRGGSGWALQLSADSPL